MPYYTTFHGNGRVSVELGIELGTQEDCKRLFDELINRKDGIEQQLGQAVAWDRLNDRRYSRLGVRRPGRIEDDDETLAEIRAWMVEQLLAFGRVFSPLLDEILADFVD